jgi:hypothetical protein
VSHYNKDSCGESTTPGFAVRRLITGCQGEQPTVEFRWQRLKGTFKSVVRDRVRLSVESEMAHIENVDFGAGRVPPVCFGFIDQERRVEAPPAVRGAAAGGGAATPAMRENWRRWSGAASG